MNRKNFLGAASALIAGSVLPAGVSLAVETPSDDNKGWRLPPYLKPGDTIGITSPAGAITPEEIQPALTLMQDWGYEIAVGDTIGKKEFTRGGTDSERLADLQQMLDDPNIGAIMCARGGYGSLRIVDRINWKKFAEHPKWLIGFSDITVLHNHIHSQYKIASIHSKMTNSFPDVWSKAEPIQIETINSIHDALAGKRMHYSASPHEKNRQGVAQGILVGGNLKTIETLAGSPSDIQTNGTILFVEDTGEYLYSIDRMFWNLERTGKLSALKGLIVGGFRIKPDEAGDEFGMTLQEIVLEKTSKYRYPVCFDFPVGHQRANFALKCGVLHSLSVKSDSVTLTEHRS